MPSQIDAKSGIEKIRFRGRPIANEIPRLVARRGGKWGGKPSLEDCKDVHSRSNTPWAIGLASLGASMKMKTKIQGLYFKGVYLSCFRGVYLGVVFAWRV